MTSTNSDSSDIESIVDEGTATYTKSNKLKREKGSLRILTSSEELQNRKKKYKDVNVLQSFSDKLKCTKCSFNFKSVIAEGRDVTSHTLLKVLMCTECCNFFGNGDFSLDEDGEDKYCRWCGEGGILFGCAKCICGFCKKCIKKHFGHEQVKEIENDDDWECFFCDPKPLWELRAICALAQEEASKNKRDIRAKRESKLVGLSKKKSKQNLASSSKKGNTSDSEKKTVALSDKEEEPKTESTGPSTPSSKARPSRKKKITEPNPSPKADSSVDEDKEKETEKSDDEIQELNVNKKSGKMPVIKFSSKRKRSLKGKVKVNVNGSNKGNLSSSSEDSEPEKSVKKKPKLNSSCSKRKEVTSEPDSPVKKPRISVKKAELSSESDSGKEEESDDQDQFQKLHSRSVQKLKDILKIIEISSELCLSQCTKKAKKLDKADYITTSEKFLTECEKIKSMVLLLSSSLTTASSSISELQSRFGLNKLLEDPKMEDGKLKRLKAAIGNLQGVLDEMNESDEGVKEDDSGEKRKEETKSPKKKAKDRSEEQKSQDEVDEENGSQEEESDEGGESQDEKKRKTKNDEEGDNSQDEDRRRSTRVTNSHNYAEVSSGAEDEGKTRKKRKSKASAKGEKETSTDEEPAKKTKKSEGKKENPGKKNKGKDAMEVDGNEETDEESVKNAKNKGKKDVDEDFNAGEGANSGKETDEESAKNTKKDKDVTKKENHEKKEKKIDMKDEDSNASKDVIGSSDEETAKNTEEKDKSKGRKGKNEGKDEGQDEDSKTSKNPIGNSDEETAKNPKKDKSEAKKGNPNNKNKDNVTENEDADEGVEGSNEDENRNPGNSNEVEPGEVTTRAESPELITDSDLNVQNENMNSKQEDSNDAAYGHTTDADGDPISETEKANDCDNDEIDSSENGKADKTKNSSDKDGNPKNVKKRRKKDLDKLRIRTLSDNSDKDVADDKDESDAEGSDSKGKVRKLGKARKILSDSSEDEGKGKKPVEIQIDSDSSDAFSSKKNKPRTSKKSESEKDTESEEEKPSKWKRIKKNKKKKASSSDSEDEREKVKKDKDSPLKGRKNIKRILKKESLHVETKQALKIEQERKKRIKDREKVYNEFFPPVLDENGRQKSLVLDFDPETKEPLVSVDKKLVKYLKPHQIQGVKFMWDSCFESTNRLQEDSGTGCILAHCMGLGKTLQVVTLVHTIMSHDLGVNTVLVVCPLNTVSNWVNEFEMWLAKTRSEPITLYEVCKYKRDFERTWQLNDWHENGGVCIISYDLFRNLTKEKKTKKKTKKKDQEAFEKTLLDPGPDIIVCDEGHLLKNEDTALSKCMRRVKTCRRIVLTGTPLQNNLIEYHCMVQFVKPNILGTKKEFMNRFVHPINNGSFEDSTPLDVRIMKRRSHVLHSLLDGCVQRFDYSVLTPYLTEKHEYVISIPLSEPQAKAYKYYLDTFSARAEGTTRGAKLFSDYHNLQRVWTHPYTLRCHGIRKDEEREEDEDSAGSLKDFVVDSDESSISSEGSSVEEVDEAPRPTRRVLRSNANDPDVREEIREEEEEIRKKWWDEFFKEDDYNDIRASHKLILLFAILQESRKVGDKVLVFSQSLYTLDLIEYFLEKVNSASKSVPDEFLDGHSDSWVLGKDYFRLDGSTTIERRTIWCKYFNKEKNKDARLFLISTRAGGLGINLTAANRVIIFDASWNPSHDVQSIFRVYRFGQTKPCFIYRFLAEATMEEKIYERQVTKLSLAHRVVDEHQIERHYTMGNLQELYAYEPTPIDRRKIPLVPKDKLFAGILTRHKEIIVGYHEHDSLLENKQEEELTEEERKAAWEEFEKERTARPQVNYGDMTQQHEALRQYMMQQALNAHAQSSTSQFNIGNLNPAMIQMLLRGQVPNQNPIMQQNVINTVRAINPSFLQNMMNVNNQNNVQNMHFPPSVLQRGMALGIRPFPGESIESFFNRTKVVEFQKMQQQALAKKKIEELDLTK